MQYDPALYTAVTSTLYRWFGIVGGVVQTGAILAAAFLTYLVRGRPGFRWTLAGALPRAVARPVGGARPARQRRVGRGAGKRPRGC
jgi:hypothetical protein